MTCRQRITVYSGYKLQLTQKLSCQWLTAADDGRSATVTRQKADCLITDQCNWQSMIKSTSDLTAIDDLLTYWWNAHVKMNSNNSPINLTVFNLDSMLIWSFLRTCIQHTLTQATAQQIHTCSATKHTLNGWTTCTKQNTRNKYFQNDIFKYYTVHTTFPIVSFLTVFGF